MVAREHEPGLLDEVAGVPGRVAGRVHRAHGEPAHGERVAVEQGHVDRYRAAARNLVDQLEALTDLECASVSSTVSATVLGFNVGVSREQDAYDTETGHGRSQGATLISS